MTAFANWLVTSTDRLDVLVNNAGVHLDLRKQVARAAARRRLRGPLAHQLPRHRPPDPAAAAAAAAHRQDPRRGQGRQRRLAAPRARPQRVARRPRDAVQLLGGVRHLEAGPGARGRRDRAQVRQAGSARLLPAPGRGLHPASPTVASRRPRCWPGCASSPPRSSGARWRRRRSARAPRCTARSRRTRCPAATTSARPRLRRQPRLPDAAAGTRLWDATSEWVAQQRASSS